MAKLETAQSAQQPDVTSDNLTTHPATQPDMLHDFVTSKLSDYTSSEGTKERDLISAALKHPNTSAKTLEHAYNTLFPITDESEAETGSDHAADNDADLLEDILAHPNSSPELAQDFLKRTYKLKGVGPFRAMARAHEKKGVPEEFKEGLLQNLLNDDKVTDTNQIKRFKLHPEAYFKLLEKRPTPEPVTPRMTASQKEKNNFVQKLDAAVLSGLPETSLHDRQSIERAISFYSSQSAPHGMDEGARRASLRNFVGSQKNIPSESLNQLNELKRIGGKDDWGLRSNVLDHPNVDPSLVAKIALTSPNPANTASDDKWTADETVSKAISNGKLPDQTRKSIVGSVKPDSPADEKKVLALLDNPATTKDELTYLYQNGFPDTVIKDNRLPEDIVNHYAESKGATTEGGRKLLQREHLPEASMMQLVSHKNQGVAIDALQHKDVTMPVINAALKRKAKEVQNAASRHPLVAKQVMRDRLKAGQLDPHDLIFNEKDREAFGDITPEDISFINNKYKVELSPDKSDPHEFDEKFWMVKNWLANSEEVPENIKDRNRRDVVDHFLNMTKLYDNIPALHDADDDQGMSHRLARYVSQLAHKGNSYAQNAALGRPYLLHELDLSRPEFGEHYLRSAYHKMKEYDQKGLEPRQRAYAHEGGDRFFVGRKAQMAHNEALPEDVFDDMYHHGEYLSRVRDYDIGGYTRSKDYNSIFDKRWGNLPEDLKHQRFERLQAVDDAQIPGGHQDSKYAIIASRKAPKDIWRSAFQQLSPEKRQKFASEHDVSDFVDPETRREILSGGYLPGNPEYERPIAQVLNSLDPTKKEDQEDLGNFLNNYCRVDEDRRVDNEDIARAIGSGFFTTPEGKGLLGGVFGQTPGLATRFAKQAAEESYKYNFDKFNELMQTGTETMFPDEKAQTMQQRWRTALREKNAHSYTNKETSILSSFINDLNDPNGNLDFLADMPEDIRETAMEQDLISHARLATEIAKTPSEINSILRKSSAYVAAKRIQGFVDAPQMSQDVIAAIIPHLNDSSFSAKQRGRDRMTDAEYLNAADYTEKLLDHTLYSVYPRNNTSMAINNLLVGRSSKGDHGALNQDRKKQLASFVISHIETSRLPETDKNKVLLNLAETMADTGLLPSSLRKNIIKRAIATKDIEILSQAAKDPDSLPTDAANAIMGAFDSPEDLNSDQIAALMNVASRKDVSAGHVQKAFDVLDGRSNAALESGNQATYAAICHSIVRAANSGLVNSDYDSLKKRFYIDKLIDFSRSNRPGADQAQIGLLNSLNSGNEHQVSQIFAALPNELDPGAKNAAAPGMNVVSINSPQVIGAALSGWKLRYMINQAADLNQEPAQVITNRIVNSDLDNDDKIRFATNLLINPLADTATVISALRAGGEDAVFDAVSRSLNANQVSHTNNWTDSNLHSALALMNVSIARTLNQESGEHKGDPFVKMDESNRDRIEYQLITASRAFQTNITIGLARSGKDGTVGQIVDDEMEAFTTNVGKTFQNVVEGVNSGQIKPGEFGRLGLMFRDVARNLCMTGGQISRGNIPSVLECTTYADRLADAVQERHGLDYPTAEIRSQHADDSSYLKKIVQSDFDNDSWDKAIAIQPKLAMQLGYRSNISSHMAESVDWNEFGENAPDVLRDWIPNLTEEAKIKIVPKILDHVMASRANDISQDSTPLTKVIYTALENAPGSIPMAFMHTISGLVRNGEIKEDVLFKAVEHGAGGSGFCVPEIDRRLADLVSLPIQFQQDIAKCPYITDKLVGRLLDDSRVWRQGDAVDNRVVNSLSENKGLDQDSVARIVSLLDERPDEYMSNSTLRNIVSHPNIREDDYYRLGSQVQHLDDEQSKRAYFSNPKWGGDAFRKIPSSLPALQGLGGNTHLIVKEADYSIPKERLNALLPVIPPEGIDWVTFKRANKNMEQLPEVKNLFMSKKGNIVTPEDVVRAIKSSDDPFHLTYGKWSGAQRHNREGANLVIQMNLSSKMEKDIAADPLRWEFYNGLTNAMMRAHPATPRIAGWIRVDTQGGQKGWIAEEFQSDFDTIEQWVPHITATGGSELNGVQVTQDQLDGYSKFIKNRIKNWHMASLKAFEDLARKHGVEAIYIHGEGIRSEMSGYSEDRESPVRIKEMYEKTPQKLGWERTDYSEYPSQGDTGDQARRSGRSTHVWKKTLK